MCSGDAGTHTKTTSPSKNSSHYIEYLYIIYEEETFEKILSARPSSRGLGWVLARDAPRPMQGARPGARLESLRF